MLDSLEPKFFITTPYYHQINFIIGHQSSRTPILRRKFFTMQSYDCIILINFIIKVYFFKNGTIPTFFHLFLSFQTNIKIFTTNICEKMSIQYMALGFELKPSERESPPITTRPVTSLIKPSRS